MLLLLTFNAVNAKIMK